MALLEQKIGMCPIELVNSRKVIVRKENFRGWRVEYSHCKDADVSAVGQRPERKIELKIGRFFGPMTQLCSAGPQETHPLLNDYLPVMHRSSSIWHDLLSSNLNRGSRNVAHVSCRTTPASSILDRGMKPNKSAVDKNITSSR